MKQGAGGGEDSSSNYEDVDEFEEDEQRPLE